MENTPIKKLIWKLAPPIMFSLLIQSLYNIIDGYFVAQYSPEGMTALSIVFPIQLLITALATGTGTGINIIVSHMDGSKSYDGQRDVIANGLWTGVFNYLLFAIAGILFTEQYMAMSTTNIVIQSHGNDYLRIILLGSIGIFIESNCTKMLQAKGNMLCPMIAQVAGAITNVILDAILIFGYLEFPMMGIQGAALATVIGQWVAMLITLFSVCKNIDFRGKLKWRYCLNIYKSGFPSVVMQSLYTVYIVGLNLILKQFSDDAVTALGIYYKLQTFFFIPLLGLQQVVVPIISSNHGAGNKTRTKETLQCSIKISVIVMAVATIVFWVIPEQLICIFASENKNLISIGVWALCIISLSFIPAGFAMMFTVYFQGIQQGKKSLLVTIVRQIVLLVPLAWIFHFWGLEFVWLTFSMTEVLAVLLCLVLVKK